MLEQLSENKPVLILGFPLIRFYYPVVTQTIILIYSYQDIRITYFQNEQHLSHHLIPRMTLFYHAQ
jgi:hypothetical protein